MGGVPRAGSRDMHTYPSLLRAPHVSSRHSMCHEQSSRSGNASPSVASASHSHPLCLTDTQSPTPGPPPSSVPGRRANIRRSLPRSVQRRTTHLNTPGPQAQTGSTLSECPQASAQQRRLFPRRCMSKPRAVKPLQHRAHVPTPPPRHHRCTAPKAITPCPVVAVPRCGSKPRGAGAPWPLATRTPRPPSRTNKYMYMHACPRGRNYVQSSSHYSHSSSHRLRGSCQSISSRRNPPNPHRHATSPCDKTCYPPSPPGAAGMPRAWPTTPRSASMSARTLTGPARACTTHGDLPGLSAPAQCIGVQLRAASRHIYTCRGGPPPPQYSHHEQALRHRPTPNTSDRSMATSTECHRHTDTQSADEPSQKQQDVLHSRTSTLYRPEQSTTKRTLLQSPPGTCASCGTRARQASSGCPRQWHTR